MSSLFKEALIANDWRVVELLLRHGENFNPTIYDQEERIQKTTLQYCFENGHSETIDVLLKYGAQPKPVDYQTPLYDAVRNGEVKRMAMIIEKTKIDINKYKYRCTSILHLAAQNNQFEVVKYMFAFTPIDVSVVDTNGRSAIHASKSIEMANLIDMLITERNQETSTIKKESKNWELESIEIDIRNGKTRQAKIDESIRKLKKERLKVDKEIKENIAKKENHLKLLSESKTSNEDPNWNECPLCLEVMKAPKTIYQCPEGHCFCSDCKPKVKLCPICRIDVSNHLSRSRVLENMIIKDVKM